MIDFLQQDQIDRRETELNKQRKEEIKHHRWYAQQRKKHHSESGAQEIEEIVDSKCGSLPVLLLRSYGREHFYS